MQDEESSSMEFQDVEDCPATPSTSTPTPDTKKPKRFRSLSLKWKKSVDSIDKSATLPQKKSKKKGIARFLSFRKKLKNVDDVAASEFSFVAAHGENLNTLHNTLLQMPPVIKLECDPKLSATRVADNDSTDSFKSAGSPELRNRVVVVAESSSLVDAQQTTLTERAFAVFKESEFINEVTIMSQRNKEKSRGRGASTSRKSDTPEPETTNPEEPAKVSGDDLRKQLTEGLKNGSGKSKDVKKELSEITQNAVQTSVEETQNFLKEEIEEKKDAIPSTSSAAADPDQHGLPPVENKKEHLYKILVIGELGTGKTSIIKRYVHQFFSQHYRATIGVDFALKVLNWDENSIIRLQLWDIAGQERFGNMTRVYYKEAVGAFIVFDVTRAATFDAVQKWKQDLDSKVQLSDGSPIPCILLANKCDQPKEGVINNKNKMDEYCRENGFAGWFETSAKENINIEDAARSLVLKILQNDKLVRMGERGNDNDKIALDGSSTEGQNSRGCSC